jgi:hypothetical protein
MEMDEEQPVMDRDRAQSPPVPDAPRRKFPMSDVRHLGAREVIEFANDLRSNPGKDLGAEALLLSRSAPVMPAKTPRPRRKKKDPAEKVSRSIPKAV